MDAADLDLRERFERDGFVVLPGAVDPSTLERLRAAVEAHVAAHDHDRDREVFRTDDRDAGREEAFFASARGVRGFLEAEALDEAGELRGRGVEGCLDGLAGGHTLSLLPTREDPRERFDGGLEGGCPRLGGSGRLAGRGPLVAEGRAARGGQGAVGGEQVVGDVEWLIGNPENRLGAGHILGVEREAVRGMTVGVVR